MLDMPSTTDVAAIKRAYATKLKAIDREHDLVGFQKLRDAYEMAMAFARGEIALDGFAEDVDVSEVRPVERRAGNYEVSTMATGENADEFSTLTDREIEVAVDEIIAACATLEHSDALMAHLAAMPALAGIAQVDAVSRGLARKVVEIDDIRYPMLAALVERFDWDTIGAGHGFAEDEREQLHAFMHRRYLRELIAKRALPKELQTHYDDLVKHVTPPFGFWRALRISSLLLRDLRDSIDAVRAAFGSDSELIVSREAEAFIRSVYRIDAPLRIAFAGALGRAHGASIAFLTLMFVILTIGNGFSWAQLIGIAKLWPVILGYCFVGVVMVRGVRRLFSDADQK